LSAPGDGLLNLGGPVPLAIRWLGFRPFLVFLFFFRPHPSRARVSRTSGGGSPVDGVPFVRGLPGARERRAIIRRPYGSLYLPTYTSCYNNNTLPAQFFCGTCSQPDRHNLAPWCLSTSAGWRRSPIGGPPVGGDKGGLGPGGAGPVGHFLGFRDRAASIRSRVKHGVCVCVGSSADVTAQEGRLSGVAWDCNGDAPPPGGAAGGKIDRWGVLWLRIHRAPSKGRVPSLHFFVALPAGRRTHSSKKVLSP